MEIYRRVIRVFIGSPSDVHRERKYFRDVIDEFNKSLADATGIQVVPLGCEDTLPGRRGRLQAIINEDIKKCDAIVLVLWKRWGSPTDGYTSGFQEEYELANALYDEERDSPRIFIYFREIPDEMITSLDEQLEKVLAFRKRIISEKNFWCTPYKSPRDWERLFRGHLTQWITSNLKDFGPPRPKEQIVVREEKKPAEVQSEPAQPITGRPQWTTVNTPGSVASVTKELLNTNNRGAGINKIAIAPDGATMWAIVRRGDRNGINQGGAQVMLYRSTDGGRSWTDTEYLKLAAAQSKIENGIFIWDLAVAPDDPNIIAVTCADIAVSPLLQEVWVSTDKGNTWVNTKWPPPNITAGVDFISAMDISVDFGNRMILVGTRDGSGLGTNNLQIMKLDEHGHWSTRDATSGISTSIHCFTGDVLAAKFSPTFPNDHTIVVVYCDGSSHHPGTWLITGTHDIHQNATIWQKQGDHVEIKTANGNLGDSPRVDEIITVNLELPSDFSGEKADYRRFYVSTDAIDRIPGITPNRGVYRINDNVIYTLLDNTATFSLINTHKITRRAASIAYFGTCASGKLMVGEVLGIGSQATVPIWFTDSPPTQPIPCWYPAFKPTTGAAGQAPNLCTGYTSGYGNAKVAWSSDGLLAYTATGAANLGPWAASTATNGAVNVATAWPAGYLNVIPFDESAFGISRNNGETWNQLSLINTLISKLTDIAPSADAKTIYLASVNINPGSQGFDSVWRSSSNPGVTSPLPVQPIGAYWERVFTHVTAPDCTGAQTDVALLRTVPYCADPSGQIIAWGVWDSFSTFTHGIAAWSPDYGDYWAMITPRNPIQDFTFESCTVMYFLSPGGLIQKMPYTGTDWSTALPDVNTMLPGAHTIAAYPDGKVIVGANFTHHTLLCGASFSSNFNTNIPSFSAMSLAGRTRFSGDMHVAFHPRFKDNNTIFACDDGILGGSVYRNNPTSQVRWEDADMMAAVNGASGFNAPHQAGQHGLILAFTGEALYSIHEVIPGSTPPENSGVCRSMDNGKGQYGPLSGMPKPGVAWDCLNILQDIITPGVTFTAQPTSLKACGCCDLTSDTTLYAIDYRSYVPASRIGMLWAYTDHIAKKNP